MKNRLVPKWLPAAAALALALQFAVAAPAGAQSAPIVINMPAQPLGQALTELAAKTGLLIGADAALVSGKQAPAIGGSYTPEAAMDALLRGSGLEAVSTGKGTYSVQRVPQSSAQELPEVKVTAAQSGYAAGKTTIASKIPMTLREIPQSVSVVTRQRMDDQNMTTLDNALRQSTGVIVQTATTTLPLIYSRGFSIDVLQYDGMPTSFNSLDANALAVQDLAIYERVEILRGAAGLLQGSGNPSAAINLVRKRPKSQSAISLTGYAGSWDFYRGELDVGGPMNASGSLRGRLVTTYEDRDYFYDVAKQQKQLVYGIVEYDVTPNTLLTVGVDYQKNKATPFTGGLPFYNNGRDIGLSRSTYLDVTWNHYDFGNTYSFAELEQRFSENWKGKLSVNHINAISDTKNAFPFGAVNPATGNGPVLIGRAQDFDNSQTGWDGFISGTFSAFGRNHDLVFGAGDRDDEYRNQAVNLPAGQPQNVFTWNPGSIAEPATPRYTTGNVTKNTQSGAYASARLSLLDSLKLILGGRLSWWDISSVNTNLTTGATTSNSSYKVKEKFTPYSGIVWDVSKIFSLYASYTDIFQPQQNPTFSGDVLKPITGSNYEAGVKSAFNDGAANASLAVFRVDQENRAQLDPAHPCVGLGCYYVASGKVRSEGFEAEISGRLMPDWDVYAGYTYNTTKYLSDRTATGAPSANEGQAFATFTPKHLLKIWTTYRMPGTFKRWTVGGGVNTQSEFYVLSGAFRLQQGGYTLVNARLAYDINEHFSAAFNVNNLLDKTYYDRFNSTGCCNWYGEPRNFMLTLRAQY